MNIQDALQIIEDFYDLQLPQEEIFAYTEALDFLIRETKQTRFMMELGGWYYEQRQFDLALKYYEMAAAGKDMQAYKCLGYIWYYGRTGKRDEEKAFRYFEKCMKAGDLQTAYKVADMNEEEMEIDIPDIEEKISRLEQEINELISTEPYLYGRVLMDPDLQEQKKTELQKELDEYDAYAKELEETFNQLLSQTGGRFTWRMN